MLTEREKYEIVWQHDGYRVSSPAVTRGVQRALRALPWGLDDTVVDVGCGSGRGALLLADAGLRVTAVDLAANAPDADVLASGAVEFVCVDAVDLPSLGRTWDWAFSCDVGEHLPPREVPGFLRALRLVARRGAYLGVSCAPDSWGQATGVGELHLTLRHPTWWLDEVRAAWGVEPTVVEARAKARCHLAGVWS